MIFPNASSFWPVAASSGDCAESEYHIRPSTSGSVYDQASLPMPGYLEACYPSGHIEVGRFTDGQFIAEQRKLVLEPSLRLSDLQGEVNIVTPLQGVLVDY